MKTRNKYIYAIIAAWVFFVLVILAISAYMSVSGFLRLEKQITIESSNRVMRVMISNLENIYSPNGEYAYWDDTYQFMKDKNNDYIEKNLTDDIFKSNKINYILFLDSANNITWEKGYDLSKKSATNLPTEFSPFFQQNGKHLIDYRQDFNDLNSKQYSFGGLLNVPSKAEIIFFVLNPITDSSEEKPANGILIFGKTLSPEFFKSLSDEIGYSINLIPLANIDKTPDSKEILKSLTSTDPVYVKYGNENTIQGFLLLKDVNFKPIAILQIDLPRTLYTESINSFLKNGLMLLIFSLIGMLSMSLLVYALFKKQELITNSFERFVPHQLIDLLNKKNILEVILGTNSKRKLSVLFMDIRNFTTISEGLTPQESFDFLNTILREIAPVVIKNNGFIDKYIGDAIMALFPNQDSNADDAVATAMMILDEIDKINYTGKINLSSPLKVGIGINTGHSILGIIGTEGRLEGTVISDAVNVASRVQSLTKTYECPLLISEETYRNMKHPDFYRITHLEDATVKGKAIKVSLYKVEKR